MKDNVWRQIKNKTKDEIISALQKDGWILDESKGAEQIYLKNNKRVSIHYHPKETFGPKLLKNLLADIGWNEDDLKRLKLIK
jgi:predicted RNA binding protein YcfA (HicA-like mRNA interferase family)